MLQGRKLLLADDSLAIQKVIELTFEDEGMVVVAVGNGQLAVERLAEVRPDIVLADVFMPELNGYEVCERIKGDEQFRHVPVILLVGSFEPFNEAEARRVGADDYLTKPFQSIRQMVSKVGALLSGNKSQKEAATQELPAHASQSSTENRANMDNLELSTADTAPLPQHMRHGELTGSDAAPKKPFADLQLDDEMIEEIPANKYSSAGQASTASHQRPTEPLSTQDLAEAAAQSATATTSHQPATAGASLLADEAREPKSASRAAASDDALLDLDDVEMPRASALSEADDFILDLQDANDARPQTAWPAEPVFSSFDSASPSIEQQPETEIDAKLAEEMTESAPQAKEYVEAQAEGSEQRTEFALVEEQKGSAEEFGFRQQYAASPPVTEDVNARPHTSTPVREPEVDGQQQPETGLAPTEQLPQNFQAEETPAQAEAASAPQSVQAGQPSTSQAGQIGLEQLSPEAIDAIARRVVEQLSTKVVEQIAWEVVPQLAELLIKRRLEEEGKK